MRGYRTTKFSFVPFSILNYKRSLFSILLIFTINTQVSAQDSTLVKFYISPQVGAYNVAKSGQGFHVGADLGVIKNKWVYALSYTRLDDFEILGPTPKEYFDQISMLIGRRGGKQPNKFQLHAQAGLVSIWGLKRTRLVRQDNNRVYYVGENFITLGLQAKTGFRIIPAKFFSIGLDLQGNVTPEITSLLWLISIELGRLR